jgi:hypothetical protein
VASAAHVTVQALEFHFCGWQPSGEAETLTWTFAFVVTVASRGVAVSAFRAS